MEKPTRILIIGQCTLHWGRMEFGNIGNYYIIEPLIRQLHEVFPNAKISTTFQMSQNFCDREHIEVLPIELYYSWQECDLDKTLIELASASIFKNTGYLPRITPYIKAVLESDLVIDFSGDIWGDNANFLGENRFFIGLCKDRIAQLLGKPTVMIAGSPGPFKDQNTLNFAKEVFENFDIVTNRESISTEILSNLGFNTQKVRNLACPAFLFEGASHLSIQELTAKSGLDKNTKPVVGFILCGWNFSEGPFDKWPRNDKDYKNFAESVEFINLKLGAKVCLMSHSNGFHIPPQEFKLTHGRDYPIVKQLEKVLTERGLATDVFTLNGIYDPWQTKGIIGHFDMLVSGRVHGAVAGLSQYVPTVIIDYGHQPKAHKLRGFAEVAGMQEYIADPANTHDLIQKIHDCWVNRSEIYYHLKNRIPTVKDMAKESFKLLSSLIN